MRTFLRSIAFAALLSIAPTLLGQFGSDPELRPDLATITEGSYVKDEILVKFKPTVLPQSMAMSVLAQRHTLLAVLEQPGWAHVKLNAGESVLQALAAYRSNPDVEHAQPNYVYHTSAVPNDTQYGQLWAFKNTGQTVTTGTYSPTNLKFHRF